MHTRPTLQAALAALSLALLFAALWAVIEQIGGSVKVSAYQVVWTRYGTHLLLLLVLVGSRRGPAALVRTSSPGRQVACSLMMLGMPLCFIGSMHRMSAPEAFSVFWSFGLMVPVLSLVVSGERVRLIQWMAAAAGLGGAVLLAPPEQLPLRAAAVFPLGMAFCFALYMVLVRDMRSEPMPAKLFHTGLWVFLALSLVSPWFWRTPSGSDMASMAAIGILGCLGLFALDRALETLSPAAIAPVICTQPAWVALLEGKHRGAAAGVVLALAGAALTAARRGGPA